MKESLTFAKIFRKLREYFPETVEEKKSDDPFFILCITIISQRTKDEVTDEVANKLKERIKKPEDLLSIPEEELEKLIFPAGFYRNKAKILKEIARTILNRYGGKVPQTLEELLSIKGIGRKTANLVLSQGYGKLAICVDTHVHRISNRLGLVMTKNPEETEFALRKIMPKKYWKYYNGLMVSFGKTICKPVSPFCSRCPLRCLCPRAGVKRWR